MSLSSISNLAIQLMATNNLQTEQNNLATLNEQLASGVQFSNLTQYAPIDAHNLMDFQNAVTQRQGYISGIQTVQTRLSLYDQTMTDMESLTSSASALATQNPTQNQATVSQINSQVQDYLLQMTDDLNQNVGGRYIYAGSRYTTPPVTSLTNLTTTPTVPFTPTSSPIVPDYDTSYQPSTSFTVDSPPTGNFQIGGTDISWSAIASGTVSSVTVDNVTVPVTVTGLIPNATSPADIASNLTSTLTQLSSMPGLSDLANVSATVNGAIVTLAANGSDNAITPDAGGANSEITWADSTDGTQAETPNSNAAAYFQDSVTVDANYNVPYGVSSNNACFQQIVAGLQLMNAATQSGASQTTYQTDMTAAASLLNTGLASLQGVHAGVAGNINTLTNETTTQNNDITNLQNQIGNIQQVNLTQVGTEINLLQTQLQASYSATASLEQLTLAKYL